MSKRRERRLRHKSKAEGDEIQDTEPEKPEFKEEKVSASEPLRSKGFLRSIENIFVNKYKVLMIIPFIILLLALGQIGFQYATTGDFLNKGVSLKGGVTLTIPHVDSVDIGELSSYLSNEMSEYDINVRKLTTATGAMSGVIIEADMTDQDIIDSFITLIHEKIGGDRNDYSIEVMGSSLGTSFFKQTIKALLLAFLFMGIIVFLYFRSPVPSFAVILAAFSDIVITLAVVNIFGMKLSTAGIAAFLMLIGYSVDTNMLLTIRVLKGEQGSVLDRVYGAMKTGIVMSMTTLVAITVALIFSNSDVLSQIMTIIFIGLLADMMNTWIQNVCLLRFYLERKKK